MQCGGFYILRDKRVKRKTFIKVRRGILEAKHVQTLGVRLPLFLLFLDMANWKVGKVIYYRDQDAADQFEYPIRKMRDWRRRLQDDGYISCLQKSDHQEITIKKWVDPRIRGYEKPAPLSYENSVPLRKTDVESYVEGGLKTVTLPYNSEERLNIKDNNILSPENEKVFIGFIKTLVGDDISKDIQTRIIKAPKRLDGDCVQLFIEEEHVRDKINKKAQLINDYILPKAVPVFFKSFECISFPNTDI